MYLSSVVILKLYSHYPNLPHQGCRDWTSIVICSPILLLLKYLQIAPGRVHCGLKIVTATRASIALFSSMCIAGESQFSAFRVVVMVENPNVAKRHDGITERND
jgi:hypothetical protein